MVSTGIDNPKSLAVDPVTGFIFWSDLGAMTRIERAGLDGDNRLVIVSDFIMRPEGLCVDTVQLNIYWLDIRLSSLSRCQYDGTNRKTLISLPSELREGSKEQKHFQSCPRGRRRPWAGRSRSGAGSPPGSVDGWQWGTPSGRQAAPLRLVVRHGRRRPVGGRGIPQVARAQPPRPASNISRRIE